MRNRFELILKIDDEDIKLQFSHRGGNFDLHDYHVNSDNGNDDFCIKNENKFILY